MTLLATYRWEMRTDAARMVYAEGLLRHHSVSDRYTLEVWLVRDEQGPLDQVDEGRVGKRVFCAVADDMDRCRMLAFMAPVEGRRLAYTLLFDTVRDNPQAVARFDDEWLSGLFEERLAHLAEEAA